MKLSILICHVPDRKPLLDELMGILDAQKTDDVEVRVDAFECKSIGEKRNRLLMLAQGDYVAFVDDDDRVSSKYVPLILDAIKTGPDCVGMRGMIWIAGSFAGYFEHSIRNNEWKDNWSGKGCVFVRPPNHLNPVKRDLAIQVKFPELSYGEDKDYSTKLFPLLKTEVMIERPIYQYFQRQKERW